MYLFLAGGDDFESPNTTINILGSPSQSICTAIFVEFDGRFEPVEMFIVQLGTDDTAVNLGLNETRVVINDSDGVFISHSSLTIIHECMHPRYSCPGDFEPINFHNS